MTSINDLQEGALYRLPDGWSVRAWSKAYPPAPDPERRAWTLIGADCVFLVDPFGAVRLIGYQDAEGVRQTTLGESGLGALTDFTVGDLQLVEG